MVDPVIGGSNIDVAQAGYAGQPCAQPFTVNAPCTITSIRVPMIVSQPLESAKIIGIASANLGTGVGTIPWLGKFTGPGPGAGWQTYLLDTPAALVPATTYHIVCSGDYMASTSPDPVLSGVIATTPKTVKYGVNWASILAAYTYFGLYGTVTAAAGGGGLSGVDQQLRAMRAYVVPSYPGAASESFTDVERKYYWMKGGGSLPVPSSLDTTYIKKLYFNGGATATINNKSLNDLELAFYQANGVPVGKSISDSALQYWSGQ